MRERKRHIDAARGFAMLMVVLGHAVQWTRPDFDQVYLFRWIYAFHMPLFMFLSGQVVGAMHKEAVLGRVKPLVWTYLTWLPVSYALNRLEPGATPGVGPLDFLRDALLQPDFGLWFLIVLAECHLLLWLCRVVGGQRWALACVGAIVLLNLVVLVRPAWNVAGLSLLRWYAMFYAGGYALAQRRAAVGASVAAGQQVTRSVGWALACSVALCVLAAFWMRKQPPTFLLSVWPALAGRHALQQLTMYAYQGVAAVVGIAAVMLSAQWWVAQGRGQWLLGRLSALGQVTLEIYASHYVFLCLGRWLAGVWALAPWAAVGLTFALALSGAWGFANLVGRHPPLSRWLFHRPVPAAARARS